MRIQNATEEQVLKMVHEVFEEERKTGKFSFCTTEQCELDVACYVLNRVKPAYFVSDRGLAHMENDYQGLLQQEADIASMINQGIKIISRHMRPGAEQEETPRPILPEPPVFNFPTIMGRVFHGENFEPLHNVMVTLLVNNQVTGMIDTHWDNPFKIAASNAGRYVFWPLPETSRNKGEERTFSLEVRIEDPRFEPLQHFRDISLKAENEIIHSFSQSESIKIKDLYVFPREEGSDS